MEIPAFTHRADPAAVVDAIHRVGCAVVNQLVDPSTLRRLHAELDPHLSRAPTSLGTFTGRRTRRTARLIAKSAAVRPLATQPLLQACIRALFAGECYHHQLAMTQALRIEPGERAQSLHRDDSTFPFKHPSPPSFINTLWALTDFTRDNGATRVVLGSHRWDDMQRPAEAQAQAVEMKAGSVLLFDGALYHGGGANRTTAGRDAMILGYSLGWLRAEEPQLVAVPREIARTLSDELLDLMGYRTHGYLGYYEGHHPRVLLQDQVPERLPAVDLYTPDLEALSIRRR